MASEQKKEAADRLLDYVNASPSPFHAVESAVKLLEEGGFTRIEECKEWSKELKKGGKYWFTRNQSSLFAFTIPTNFQPGQGAKIIAAHSDSPCLKLKPVSYGSAEVGWCRVGVQTYGGGIWHTWFDRDLALAGRVVLSTNNTLSHKLVRIHRPLLRVPTLCIHLDRSVKQSFSFNNETQLAPILATEIKAQLESKQEGDDDTTTTTTAHHPLLLKALADELSCSPSDIKDFELCLYDYTDAIRGGVLNEFLFCPRLDNLFSSFCAVESLVNFCKEEEDEENESFSLIALFDNEEVGSVSANGANSNLMEHVLQRITHAFPAPSRSDLFERAVRRSFLISADMAHAVHPAYVEKHEKLHRPLLHRGLVIKQNADQRYATSAWTGALLRELANRHNVPIQEFVVRNDSACGSTIGPCLSSRGFRTIDVGAPQLSMHSIREMCGADDVQHTLDLFRVFFKHFEAIDKELVVD